MTTTKALANGGYWIEGCLTTPPEGINGPLVFGANWLLEMIRSEDGVTWGFFWAPFAIIRVFPELPIRMNGRFVGFSFHSDPPAAWLTASMAFDLGDTPLASSPEEYIARIQTTRPFVLMEEPTVLSVALQAKNYIVRNYRTDLAISEVAGRVGVSHAHLTRQFKRSFGLTPIDYLHRLRVSEAIGRLSLGEPTLTVGYDVGFNDATRFYKDFRKVTGTSPGRCRQSLQ